MPIFEAFVLAAPEIVASDVAAEEAARLAAEEAARQAAIQAAEQEAARAAAQQAAQQSAASSSDFRNDGFDRNRRLPSGTGKADRVGPC